MGAVNTVDFGVLLDSVAATAAAPERTINLRVEHLSSLTIVVNLVHDSGTDVTGNPIRVSTDDGSSYGDLQAIGIDTSGVATFIDLTFAKPVTGDKGWAIDLDVTTWDNVEITWNVTAGTANDLLTVTAQGGA